MEYARNCAAGSISALFLDPAHRLLAEDEMFRGTLDRAVVEPRIILRRALVERATGVVVFHTHPSGDPAPTAEDIEFTRRLAEAAEVLGVRMIDHLIVGVNGRWVSMRQRGGWR